MNRILTALVLTAAFAVPFIGTSTEPAHAQGGNVVVLSGDITQNIVLKKKKTYLLQGGVFVRSGAKMTIKAGTTIFGDTGSFLCIDRGAKIIAKGTAAKPIVFTSAQPANQRRRGDWGGIIFNGSAPLNIPGGVAQGEGGTGEYGGTNVEDNQGTLRYVRVEFGGFPISPDNELNCVAFQGTGSGTTVEFVEALNGGDDGFEWFGGSVNARNIISIGSQDDSMDWTFGWNGMVQFAVVQQRADGAGVGDRAIEADNNETDFSLTPRSSPQFQNVTFVGDPDPTFSGSTQGIELRRGTAGQLRNFIVMGFKNNGLRITDQATYDQYASSALDLQGFIFFNNKNGANLEGTTLTAIDGKGLTAQKILNQVDPQLANPFSKTAPDFRPAASSPALVAANIAPKFADSFFVTANYVGAFDSTNDWMAGWTSFVSPAQ